MDLSASPSGGGDGDGSASTSDSEGDNGEDGVLIAKNTATAHSGSGGGVANYPPPKSKAKSKQTSGNKKHPTTHAAPHASASINDDGSSIAAQSSLDAHSSSSSGAGGRKSKSVTFAKKSSSSSSGSGSRSGITPASTLPLPSGESDRDRVSSISFLLHAQECDPSLDEFAPPPKRPSCFQRHVQTLACLCIILLLGVGFLAHVRWNVGPDTSVRSYFNGGAGGPVVAAQSSEAADAAAAKTLLHSHRLASAADRFEDDDLPPLPHFSPPPRRLRPDDADSLAITDVELPRDRSDPLHRPLTHAHAPVPRHIVSKGPHLPTTAELDAQARELLKGGLGVDDELHLGTTLDDSALKPSHALHTDVGLKGSASSIVDESDVEAELHRVEAEAAAEVAAAQRHRALPHPRASELHQMHSDLSALPKIHLDIDEAFKAHASHPKHTAATVAKAHEQFVSHPPQLDQPHPRLPVAHKARPAHPRFAARARHHRGAANPRHAHGYDVPQMVFDQSLKAREDDDDDTPGGPVTRAPAEEQEDHPFEAALVPAGGGSSALVEMQARFPLGVAALPPHALFPFGALASLASSSLVQATISPRGLFPYCLACERRCAHVVKSVEFFARNQQPQLMQVHAAATTSAVDAAATSKLRALGSNLSAFHRATAHLGHEDFHHLPRAHALRSKWSDAAGGSTLTTLQGDLHLGNFGVSSARTFHWNQRGFIAESSAQSMVFEINDFDAGFVSAEYWRDLIRLGSSIVFTMRENPARSDDGERRTYGQDQISAILQTMLKGYHDSIAAIASAASGSATGPSSHASLSSHSLSLATLPPDSPLISLLEKTARKRTRVAMLDRFAPRTPDGSTRHFAIGARGSKLEAVSPQEEREIHEAWPRMQQSLGIFARETLQDHRPSSSTPAPTAGAEHTFPPWVPLSARQVSGPFMASHILESRSSYFRLKSLARRVGSGLASRGARRYYALIEGPTPSADDDVILDLKQEGEAEWLHFIDPSALHRNAFYGSAGARVARAIHALLPGLMSPTPHASFATPDPHTAFVELHGLSDGAAPDLPELHSAAAATPPRHSSDSFLVRERSPWKRKLKPRKILRSHADWLSLAGSVGAALAAAHCRSDAHYDARFVPGYFSRGFLAAVPLSLRALWTQDLESAVWAEVARREGDYACWIEHAQNQEWSKNSPAAKDDEEEDDEEEDEE